jgi:hypothetical protein
VRLHRVPARPVGAAVEAEDLAALALTIWLTFEVASLGTWMSTATMGSSSTGEHCGRPSFMAMRPAVLNAISEESTA